MKAAQLTFGPNGTDRDASFDSTLRYAIEAGIVPAESSPQLIRRLYEIFRANYEATLNYRHEPLDRDITLLRSIERTAGGRWRASTASSGACSLAPQTAGSD